jgi:hypothetical protein
VVRYSVITGVFLEQRECKWAEQTISTNDIILTDLKRNNKWLKSISHLHDSSAIDDKLNPSQQLATIKKSFDVSLSNQARIHIAEKAHPDVNPDRIFLRLPGSGEQPPEQKLDETDDAYRLRLHKLDLKICTANLARGTMKWLSDFEYYFKCLPSTSAPCSNMTFEPPPPTPNKKAKGGQIAKENKRLLVEGLEDQITHLREEVDAKQNVINDQATTILAYKQANPSAKKMKYTLTAKDSEIERLRKELDEAKEEQDKSFYKNATLQEERDEAVSDLNNERMIQQSKVQVLKMELQFKEREKKLARHEGFVEGKEAGMRSMVATPPNSDGGHHSGAFTPSGFTNQMPQPQVATLLRPPSCSFGMGASPSM